MASADDDRAVLDLSDLKKKTLHSSFWTTVRVATDQVITFLVFALLARFVTPAEFGVFALALLYTEVGRALLSSGLVDNVIRSPVLTPSLRDTIFWANLTLAVLIAVIGVVAAGPVARAIGAPSAATMISAVGLVLPIAALGSVHMALRLREFGHRALATRSLVSGVAGGIAALCAALMGLGVWSFVVQRLVSESLSTLMSWRAHPWWPGRNASFRILREIWAFSANMSLTQLLYLGLTRFQDLVISRTMGTAGVGVYRVAWKTIELIAQMMIVPFATVSLATLSRLQDDPEGFATAYRKLVATAAIIAFPAMIGFGVLADKAIPVLYGPNWSESVRIVWVLTPMVVPFTFGYFVAPALAAKGQSTAISIMASIQLGLTVVLSLLAAPYGIEAIAASYVLRAYLTMPVQLWFLRRGTGVTALSIARGIAPSLGASVLMAAAMLLIYGTVLREIGHPVLFLLAMTLFGAAAYAVFLIALGGRGLRQDLSQMRRMVAGQKASQPAE